MKKDHHEQAASELPRREFIKKSGAVAGAAALATGTLLQPAEGWAQTLSTLNSAQARTLLQMCRECTPMMDCPCRPIRLWCRVSTAPPRRIRLLRK